MTWPITLTRDQGEALKDATRDFMGTLSGEGKALYGVLLHQMEHGVTLGLEEQEMARLALLRACRAGAGRHAETAYFKIYGQWCVDPPYWLVERRAKKGLT